MCRVRFVALAAGLGLALAAAPAPAQEVADPCAPDIQRLCPDLKPGRKLQRCIQARRAEFSPECKAHIQERADRRRAFQESCADDVRTFCVNIQAGRGRVRRCLLDNEQMLSPECRSAVQQTPDAP